MEAVGGVLRAVYGLVLSIQLVNLRCSFHAAHRGVHIACLSSDRSCTRWKSCTHKDAATSSIPTHHDIDIMYMLDATHVFNKCRPCYPTLATVTHATPLWQLSTHRLLLSGHVLSEILMPGVRMNTRGLSGCSSAVALWLQTNMLTGSVPGVGAVFAAAGPERAT
jgi:hypothetical protein